MTTFPAVPELVVSERLDIRSPQRGFAAAVVEAVQESLPELKPWMPWATDDYGPATAEEVLLRAIADFATRQDLRYYAFERASGRLVCLCGLHRMRWEVPRFEVGYWVRTTETGKGYATEATLALTRMAFEDLGAKRVDLRCDDLNLRSAAVAERCGFTLEGVLRNYAVGTDGTVRDERVYAVTDLSQLRA